MKAAPPKVVKPRYQRVLPKMQAKAQAKTQAKAQAKMQAKLPLKLAKVQPKASVKAEAKKKLPVPKNKLPVAPKKPPAKRSIWNLWLQKKHLLGNAKANSKNQVLVAGSLLETLFLRVSFFCRRPLVRFEDMPPCG